MDFESFVDINKLKEVWTYDRSVDWDSAYSFRTEKDQTPYIILEDLISSCLLDKSLNLFDEVRDLLAFNDNWETYLNDVKSLVMNRVAQSSESKLVETSNYILHRFPKTEIAFNKKTQQVVYTTGGFITCFNFCNSNL
jgi:hypothetical protein